MRSQKKLPLEDEFRALGPNGTARRLVSGLERNLDNKGVEVHKIAAVREKAEVSCFQKGDQIGVDQRGGGGHSLHVTPSGLGVGGQHKRQLA